MENCSLVVNRTAKNTEIMLGYFLQNKIFVNMPLVVGDENGKFPDIHSVYGSLGIEVVQAEQAEDFASSIIWKKYDKFKGDANKLKAYIRTKLSNYEVKLFINKNKVEAWQVSMFGHSAYYSKHLFETVMRKKLEKLNNGNYASISGEINLGIVSIFRAKPDRTIKEIQQKYEELKQDYPKTFSRIFVLFTDALFEINQEKISKYELTDQDFEALKTNFKILTSKK